MHFVNVMFTLMAASAVMAAPAQDATAKAQVDCPNGWVQCGECNGTSCQVAGTDRNCVKGSCTKQSGAGDSSICGSSDPFAIMDMECPGKA